MGFRSCYDAWVADDIIFVEDLNQPDTLSVTNDAERVVREVTTTFGDDKRILYYDSYGDLDELVHDKGTFVRFAPGPSRKKDKQ